MSTSPDKLYHMGGAPVGCPEVGPRTSVINQKICYFVDANNGSDSSDGFTWASARATIQSAVTSANSNKHRLDNVDIYVANGNYEETVTITHTALGGTVAQKEQSLVWQNMGSNCGYLGTLRIIGGAGVTGAGHNKWTCGVGSVDPCLYIGRPNVEVYGFNFQNDSGGVAAGSWSLTTESGGHAQEAMPSIHVQDQYNIEAAEPTQVLSNGAGNNVLIKNCRLNSGGVLNSGAKWVHVEDCMLEYCGYGVGMIANSKGRASESHVTGCKFSQNTYDIEHGYAICCWVEDCRFLTSGAQHLFPLAAHAASTFCVISNSEGSTEAKFCSAKNSGWIAQNIGAYDGTANVSSAATLTAASDFKP